MQALGYTGLTAYNLFQLSEKDTKNLGAENIFMMLLQDKYITNHFDLSGAYAGLHCAILDAPNMTSSVESTNIYTDHLNTTAPKQKSPSIEKLLDIAHQHFSDEKNKETLFKLLYDLSTLYTKDNEKKQILDFLLQKVQPPLELIYPLKQIFSEYKSTLELYENKISAPGFNNSTLFKPSPLFGSFLSNINYSCFTKALPDLKLLIESTLTENISNEYRHKNLNRRESRASQYGGFYSAESAHVKVKAVQPEEVNLSESDIGRQLQT